MHSATKFLGGHGTSIGGVIVDSGAFPWDNGNFPVMTEPVATYGNLRFWDNFGEYGFATKLRVEGLRNLGGVLSPFNAFLILQGMETLPLRMDAHVANAADRRRVARRRPARELGALRRAARTTRTTRWPRSTCRKGPGAVFSFGLPRAGARRARRFIGAVELCSHLANVGRHAHARHPPRLDHPPPALRAEALRGGRRAARAGAHQRRHRGRRRHPLRPRSGARMSCSEPCADLDAAGRARAPRDPAPREDDRRRRRVGQPGAREQLRAHLPAAPRAPTTRSGRSRPTRTRSSA